MGGRINMHFLFKACFFLFFGYIWVFFKIARWIIDDFSEMIDNYIKR